MKLKKFISIGLVSALLMTTASVGTSFATENSGISNQAAAEQKGTASINNKSEVLYGKLSANGNVNAVYVVNHFEVEKSGSIIDYGNYKSVQNLTDSKELLQSGDSVTFQAEAGDYYYQGNMEAVDLPWLLEISYDLNGEIIEPQDLAGKSGKVGIHIKSKQNDKVDSAFFENYMLQISLTLDSEKCSNINAPDATIADAGNNTMLAFTVMPNKNADFKVTADVVDFTMNGIEISGMPFSMSIDLPDTDGMIKDFEKLPDAISELNEGVGKLADGTSELKKGANELKNGSGEFKRGLSELKENSSQITEASAQINTALATIATSLNSNSSGADFGDLTQLPTALGELSTGLKGISGGLKELKTGYTSAYAALDSMIQNIPDQSISKEQINLLFPNANEKQSEMLDQLYTSYTAGQTVKGTYSQVKLAFTSVAPTIETLSGSIDKIAGGLDEISAGIESALPGTDITAQLGQLTMGLSELANNYSKFDLGLKEYMSGVGKLSDGYNQFNSGLYEFVAGVGELNSGVAELHEGTNKFNDEVSNMPDQIQEEISQLTEEYIGTDFEAISFASPKNTNTGLVQFVLKCEGIELPEEDNTVADVSDDGKEETVLDRLIALFKKD